MSKLAIEVRGLRKSYGTNVAVDGIDLAVAEGEVFGLLGPNGAGKTSTIEILEGIRARSGGEALVLGLDPTTQSAALKDRVGVCLQDTNLPASIRVGEAMRLFSRLYSRVGNSDQLLGRVGLADKKNAFYRTLSGGQKQRLAIALALINAPSLVFFDEPTTGLDPQVRREIHALIGELRTENCTVLLTTHYIEEAERLCGRVAIMDRGRIVALGTPREIQEATLGKALVEARFEAAAPTEETAFPAAFSVERREDGRELALRTNEPGECVAQLVRWCDHHGLRLEDIAVRRASLEDAFIALTGRALPRLPMKAYFAHTEHALRLLSRNKTALFFTYLFPLFFFFMFATTLGGAKYPGAMLQVISTVLTVGVLGSGFFGAGVTMVQEREDNILRRFKVTPSGALPIILAVLTSGLVAYLPLVAVIVGLAHGWLHVAVPARIADVVIFSAVGLLAFRGIGVLIACVVRSTQESQAIINVIYLPMLMLSGAMLPLQFLPPPLQKVTAFLPSYYLFNGMQSMLLNGQGLAHSAWELLALVLTAGTTSFLALKLFRWDRDDIISGRAKWWIVAGLAPFVLLGLTRLNTGVRLDEARMQRRAERRNHTFVVENVRVFVGDGSVIEHARVLVRNGRIVEVGEQSAKPAPPDAEVVNGAGKTLLPGLIDMHIHLGASGFADFDINETKPEERRLMDYLYCGVTAVRSVGDWLDKSKSARQRVEDGRTLGAELFAYGPLFTAEGGHGTEYLKAMPDPMQENARQQFLRIPKDPADAERMVGDLKRDGVDGVKAILQGDFGHTHFVRLERPNYEAVARAAHANALPLATHTNTVQDVEDAIAVGSDSIEHGALTDRLPLADLTAMHEKNLAYDPTLSVVGVLRGNLALNSPLLQEIAPPDKLKALAEKVPGHAPSPKAEEYAANAVANLVAAWQARVTLIAGSDAGNPSIIHGPTVQHELALWVEAGIPASIAIQAATGKAAQALRAEDRIGFIVPGRQATFIIVEGDPVADIHALERVGTVVFRGEIVDREALLEAAKEP